MTLAKLDTQLRDRLSAMQAKGISKGKEKIITGFKPAENGLGPRVLLQNYPDRTFLRMNANAYLGLSNHPAVIAAESKAAETFGAGPGAVRFISGTYQPHIDLENRLAEFHDRHSAMLFSAAYAAMIGILPALIDEDTLVVSDALNHNCIINAIRLAKTARKAVYPHLDLAELERILIDNKGQAERVIIVTDGVFSMRGDHAQLDKIDAIRRKHETNYKQGILTVVDDSHGIGALGPSGRGTEEITASQADILIATLGKALGVNGGYAVSSRTVIDYLRETSASYIYSNPITPPEAAAALAALNILDSTEGKDLLNHIKTLALRLRNGLTGLGFETLPGAHPIVPILVRNTDKTTALVEHCFEHDILVTGLNYPVVAKGEQEIRLQISATHTEKDIYYFLDVLSQFKH
ncbi:MAG: aminotransferase class I/II-fold pyridoxal phosphate-dependent enzyme [Gammaproteobacteria bacterium]|nr:aminotransferase class I/II-fold pyridoxal phosphate-dependent enzyme [Gammaproteobacteria bacterium]